MTLANRALGVADQHLERPLRRDVPARLRVDPALRRVQPGGARPAHPGLPPRRGGVAAGDGQHGRLRPHPRLRARSTCPTQAAGRRLPAALRAAPGARRRRPGDDRRDGRARRPSPRSSTSRTSSRREALDVIAAARGGLRRRLRARRPAASSSRTAAEGADDGRRRARLGARDDRRRRRRPARGRRAASARSGSRTFRPWPMDEVREALRDAERVVVVEKALATGIGGVVVARRARRPRRPADPGARRHRRARRPRRSPRRRCAGSSATRCAATWHGPTFLDLDTELVERELERMRRDRRSGPHEVNLLRDLAGAS